MAKQTINLGTSANDGTGDPLRTAFDKINDNFDEIYNELGGSTPSNLGFSGNSIISDNTNGDIELDPNGTGKVIINADLEVKGSSTQVNATVMQVEDNLVEFNRNSSGGDIDAGMYIQRGGAGNNAVFYWNEGDDKFKAVLSTSAATATSVTDSSTATIVANIESDTVSVNTISSSDSSRVLVSDTLQVTGTILVNTISSEDSSAVTISDALSVTGGIYSANIDTSVITCGDSAQLTINTDLSVQGNLTAKELYTEMMQSNDSTSIVCVSGIDVQGVLKTSSIEALDSTQIQLQGVVAVASNLQVGGNLSVTADTVFAVVDNMGTSTTALSTSTTVHSIAAGEGGYTLANGNDGQVMYFIPAGSDFTNLATTKITIANVRNPNDGTLMSSYEWYPFIGQDGDSTVAKRTLATILFSNGGWHLDRYTG